MYYHNSPTTKKIKQLKAAKAAKMALHFQAMKQTTNDYTSILNDLKELRQKEIAADQLLQRFPDKAGDIDKKMQHNYKIMDNKLNRLKLL